MQIPRGFEIPQDVAGDQHEPVAHEHHPVGKSLAGEGYAGAGEALLLPVKGNVIDVLVDGDLRQQRGEAKLLAMSRGGAGIDDHGGAVVLADIPPAHHYAAGEARGLAIQLLDLLLADAAVGVGLGQHFRRIQIFDFHRQIGGQRSRRGARALRAGGGGGVAAEGPARGGRENQPVQVHLHLAGIELPTL
ncbi:MAG: hypothetical protein U1F77_13085 [Kiritimatiellia bacterium]